MDVKTCRSYFKIQCANRLRVPKHELWNTLWEDLVLVGTPFGGVMHEHIFIELSLEVWYRKPPKSQTKRVRQLVRVVKLELYPSSRLFASYHWCATPISNMSS